MGALSGQEFQFGDFRLDLDDSLLFRGGERIHLRPQAMRALCFLVQQDGIVSRQALTRAVWNGGLAPDDQALSALIREIRQALGDLPQSPKFIETIPTRGYRFIRTPRPARRPATGWTRPRPGIAAAFVAIVVLLAATIRPEFPSRQSAPITIDDLSTEVRHTYLAGLKQFRDGDPTGSRERLNEVIDAYPGFAEAHLWLAKSFLDGWGVNIDDALTARPHVERALELNDRLAPAYVSLGSIEMIVNLDAGRAAELAERALQIDPLNVDARMLLIDTRLAIGDASGSLQYVDEIAAIDPLRLAPMGTQGWIHFMAGNYELAIEHCAVALNVIGSDLSARQCLFESHVALGDDQAALEQAHAIMASIGGVPIRGKRMQISAALDDFRNWRLEQSRSRLRSGGDPYAVAVANASLGNVSEAVSNLAQLLDERRYPSIAFIASDPRLRLLATEVTARPALTAFSH